MIWRSVLLGLTLFAFLLFISSSNWGAAIWVAATAGWMITSWGWENRAKREK